MDISIFIFSWVGILAILGIIFIFVGVASVVKARRIRFSSCSSSKYSREEVDNYGPDYKRIILGYNERIKVKIRSKKGRGKPISGTLIGYLVNSRGEKVFALIETTNGGTPAKRCLDEVEAIA